jgi:serine/threonine protein kinase/Tfp pilus assembly protein PilF
MWTKSFVIFAPCWRPPPELAMNAAGISDSVRMAANLAACAKCGSTSRVGRGFCLNCLLQCGLEADTGSAETLDKVLAEIEVRDADWRIGNYQILEEIGRGGMGVIYRARQRHSRRIVAVKRVLSYHSDSRETLARFRREAQAAASLDHPNILPIYEVSESEDGLPFFSMKFAPGGSLQEVGPALRNDPRQCVALVAKIARAVQYAHSRGILHRDLKPGNILLDGRGEPLVSDFGLAKWLDTTSDLTRTLTVFGTPGYIAPEQASGPAAQLKPAADVYSLGAILFDLLAGRPPFLGTHALSVIRQAAETPAPKLRTLSKIADRDLETICAHCLERDPPARYRSAHELAEDLERWLEGRPIIARRTLPPVRIWRWAKRTPQLAVSFSLCLLLGIAIVARQIHSRRLQATIEKDALAYRSIAVLPFLNLDTAEANRELGEKTAESLRAELARVGPTRIIFVPRAQSAPAAIGNIGELNEANRESKCRAVLIGTERRVNGRSRVAIRLLDAGNADLLLAKLIEETPEKPIVFDVVRAMVAETNSILNTDNWDAIAVSKRDPGLRNEASREFIVSGRQLMLRANVNDIDRSISCFEKALEITPDSALAHGYLAGAAAARLHYGPANGFVALAENEAKEALRLEPDSPEAHRALAGLFYHTGDLSKSLEEQFRAIEVSGPEERVASLAGLTLIALGRSDRALGWLEMAKRWAALPGDYDALIGDCWTLIGDDKRAEDAYHRSINLRPEIPEGWVGLCHLRLLQGDPQEARKLCKQNLDRFMNYRDPNNDPREMLAQIEFFTRNYGAAEGLYSELQKREPSGGENFYGGVDYASALGRLKQLANDAATGRRLLEEAGAMDEKALPNSRGGVTLYRLAAIESSLGNTESALEHLRQAILVGWTDARSPQLDPRFDAIAPDPRFRDIIATLTKKLAELQRQLGQPIKMAANGERISPQVKEPK